MEILELWFWVNSLDLNISKTKEMVVDFRRDLQKSTHPPLSVSGTSVEKLSIYKYVSAHEGMT